MQDVRSKVEMVWGREETCHQADPARHYSELGPRCRLFGLLLTW